MKQVAIPPTFIKKKKDALHEKKITFVTTSIIGLAPAKSRIRERKLPLKSTMSTYTKEREGLIKQTKKKQIPTIDLNNELGSDGYSSG
jgi:hypothetical protein